MSPALSALAATLHLLALGIGLGAAFARARALRGPMTAAGVQRVLYADNWYGIAAMLWIGTGLWRAFGPVAKTWAYYRANSVFHAKLGLFALVFALELLPMITFIRWRIALGRGAAPNTSRARLLAWLTTVQVVLIVVIVALATMMARGVGM